MIERNTNHDGNMSSDKDLRFGWSFFQVAQSADLG